MGNQIEGLSNRRENRIFIGMWVDENEKAFFTVRAEPNSEGSLYRKTKNGKDRWEYRYDTITGLIDKVYVKEDQQYGLQWVFEISQKDNQFILTLGYDSGRALSLLKQLPNCDVSLEMSLQASPDRIFVVQNGANIKWYWSQEANPLPEWEWYDDPSTGKKKANKTKELNVIREFYETNMAQRFSYMGMSSEEPTEVKEEAPPPQEEPEVVKTGLGLEDEIEEVFGPDEPEEKGKAKS